MASKPPPGRRFEKGKSGNPGGRPKAVRDVAAAAREHTQEGLETLVTAMRDGGAPWNARIRAVELILERGWGKPMQAVELSGPDGDAIQMEAKVGLADKLARLIAARRDEDADQGGDAG
jgi:hypothetical protein